MAKQEVARGTRKQFEVYITDADGNPQDPDSCLLTLIKTGEYAYDSPRGPYTCSKTGTTGYWGAEPWISSSITLGDWVGEFTWWINGVPDSEKFPFVIVDKVRPYLSKHPVKTNVEVVG